jgi:oxygen-independent coproporphyrinogen-3 oxidase
MIAQQTQNPSGNARQRIVDLKHLQEAGLVNLVGEFYPSVHYPPITMYRPITEEELLASYTLPADGLLDVYIHLPFCQQRCIFCHYPVQLGNQHEEKDRYLAALEREMDLYLRRLGIERVQARSILVGGGTPTYLTPGQLERFLKFFTHRVDLARCRQFNYDVDPGTLVGPEGIERLRLLRSYGVDRLTIGVQSLNDDILKLMNRPHDVRVAVESIENSLALGFQVNIEFIFGHPGETLENWAEVIEKAVALGVEEIQLYRLKVEAYGDYQGPIRHLRQTDPETFPDAEEALMMKQLAIDVLAEHGYHENLRRVFSKERKHYSRYAHNQCCMLYDEIGFGLTAFSSLRDRFGLNTQYFPDYYAAIEAGRLPLNRGLVRSPEEQMRWAIVLPLKNRDVRKDLFHERTGRSLDRVFRAKIENLKAFGLLVEDERSLELTPLGAFFADEVAEQFCHPRHLPFPEDAYAPGPLNPYRNQEE